MIFVGDATKKYLDNDNYIVIDTDEIIKDTPTSNKNCIEFREYLKSKYNDNIPNIYSNFSIIYRDILKYYNIDIAGKNVVVVGRSDLVGKPMASLMLNNNATVTICHSKTSNLKEFTIIADILVVAVGKKDLITEDMVKDGAVVIDVGMNRVDNKLYGDVDFENVSKKASYITPVPGGVGQMTVAELGCNVYKAYKLRRK